MTTRPRRAIAPPKVTTVGTPLTGDFRALAALLVKLDARPPVQLVPTPKPHEVSDVREIPHT